MASKTRSKWKAPNTCRECEHWDEVSEKVRIHELLDKTLCTFETKIANKDYEPTLAEYVKLLQLGKEMGQEDEPKEVIVTWVGPTETSDSEI
jgi:hypothetical protein